MSVDIEKLEALAKAATPGPWNWRYEVLPWLQYHKPCVFAGKHDIPLASLNIGAWKGEKNAEYIVAACNAVPELIKMYREADDEAADANSAWQKVRRENLALRERVRELEQQNSFFLKALKEEYACPYSRCKYDFGAELDEWGCSNEDHQSCWVQAAKEAGE